MTLATQKVTGATALLGRHHTCKQIGPGSSAVVHQKLREFGHTAALVAYQLTGPNAEPCAEPLRESAKPRRSRSHALLRRR